jgi:hypothetical protein
MIKCRRPDVEAAILSKNGVGKTEGGSRGTG